MKAMKAMKATPMMRSSQCVKGREENVREIGVEGNEICETDGAHERVQSVHENDEKGTWDLHSLGVSLRVQSTGIPDKHDYSAETVTAPP
jgi:hypothetical protein